MKLTVANDHGAEPQDKPIVLVADDSRVMRVALTRILKEQYTVLEAEHGEDAWAKLTAEAGVQMVFSDLSMPELDGFGLLGRIRGSDQPRIREVPFIVITGNEDDQAVREQAMAGGATDFILKPFQSVEIKARAKAHVDHLRKLGAASQALEAHITQDETTGLANRRHFTQRAQEALAFAARQQLPVAVLQIQLDRYQSLRHEHGEDGAREALTAAARILRSHTRTEDTAAHFGDGLFVMLSLAADQVGAAQLAGRVAEAVANARGAHLSVSVGIAIAAPGSADGVDELLARAERLLASAVRKGGNTVVAEDYVQAHQPAAANGANDAVVAELRERLQARDQELETERAQRAQQSQELERLRQELESACADASAQRAALDAEQAARAQAEEARQQLAGERDAFKAEVENLRYGASNAETVQAELQHTIDSLRAQLEEVSAALEAQRQQLESELTNRHAVESELAKLKLQDVARQEAERKAAEQAAEASRKGGLLAGLRRALGRGKPSG